MTKRKTPARRQKHDSSGGEAEATLVQLPEGTSPAAAEALNIRLNGGVIEHKPPMGEAERTLRELAKSTVELPRLDRTIIDPVFGRIMPTDQPVTVSYSVAYTLGLLDVNPNNPPAAIRQQSLVTEPQSEGGKAAEDNGHGGTGRESGYEQPALELASQPTTLDEIEEAAKDAGMDNEGVLARRDAELNARREALFPPVR